MSILEKNEILEVFEKAREQGKAKHMGVTGHQNLFAHQRMLARTANMDIFETEHWQLFIVLHQYPLIGNTTQLYVNLLIVYLLFI